MLSDGKGLVTEGAGLQRLRRARRRAADARRRTCSRGSRARPCSTSRRELGIPAEVGEVTVDALRERRRGVRRQHGRRRLLRHVRRRGAAAATAASARSRSGSTTPTGPGTTTRASRSPWPTCRRSRPTRRTGSRRGQAGSDPRRTGLTRGRPPLHHALYASTLSRRLSAERASSSPLGNGTGVLTFQPRARAPGAPRGVRPLLAAPDPRGRSQASRSQHVVARVDRRGVLDQEAVGDAVLVGLQLVVGLHDLDEADHVAGRDRVALVRRTARRPGSDAGRTCRGAANGPCALPSSISSG